MTSNPLTNMALGDLKHLYPYVEDFFSSIGINDSRVDQTLEQIVAGLPDQFSEDCGMDRDQLLNHFTLFMQQMEDLGAMPDYALRSITIVGGHDKQGKIQDMCFTMHPGEIVCIVGPTGSGKSRLLADIECLAQKDTPTGRQILVNGDIPENGIRFSMENKLVAQLSQNMNFVIDLGVRDFITMHAESRMVEDIESVVNAIIHCANELSGEEFSEDMPLAQLSGGQSRSLMIADTAFLSASPIVLIDELENAGVDRKKALDLLVKKEKIVLISTHDPILALLGRRRLVMKNGGIYKVIEAAKCELENLSVLQRLDSRLMDLRDQLRQGNIIDFDVKGFLQC